MAKKEHWRTVVGHAAYEVSDRGRVRSARGLLRPGGASNGYLTVALGRGNTRTVHSLVAEAFLGARPRGCEVMHLDGGRRNNRASNLRYGTRSENNRQAVADGRRKLTPQDIRWARRAFSRGVTGAAVARRLGISQSQASNIKHGRQYRAVS